MLASTIRRLTVAVAAAATATTAAAQTTVGTAEDGSALCVPFGCTAGATTRYQQVYSSAAFAGPMTIGSMTFYHLQAPGATLFAPATFEITLSTTSRAVGALSESFDDNVGAGAAAFATVALSGSAAAPTFTIVGTPFTYDPSMGNLLVDWRISNVQGDLAWFENTFFDADYSGTWTSSVWDQTWVPGVTEYVLAPEALVTTFNPAVTATPEPASLALVGVGLLALGGAAGARRRARG